MAPTGAPAGSPCLPTVGESGLPGFEAVAWFGLLAPAGTPPAVLQRLEAETQKALAGSVMKERLMAMGTTLAVPTAAAFTRLIQDETRKWAPKTSTPVAQHP